MQKYLKYINIEKLLRKTVSIIFQLRVGHACLPAPVGNLAVALVLVSNVVMYGLPDMSRA